MSRALVLQNLSKTYANGFQALKDVSLEVQEGDFFALLGPNGAGKSTIIGIINSLVKKSSGSVTVLGHNIDTHFEQAKKLLGVMPQEVNFSPFEKIIDILVTQAGYFGLSRKTALARAEKYLHQLQLWEKRDQASRLLSGGMKRRLMIARALIHEPKILILDEPTAGVDIELRRSMWAFMQEINRQGTTIILTTHYLEEAENLCRHVAILDKGKIIENTPIKNLLSRLHQERFVLDLKQPHPKPLHIEGYKITQIDDHTLEVEISKQQNINQLFEKLSQQQIEVSSLRNKANRLEELFIYIVQNSNKTV